MTGVTNYQWLRNGTNIVGATNATLSFSPLAFANFGGNYSVAVNDGAYTTWSANATVLPPAAGLVINTPPVSRAAAIGTPASFSVIASTTSGSTNYQWMMSNTNVTGANYAEPTTATLNITSAQLTNFGPYKVRVGDGFNFVTSSVVNLTIAAQPTITNSLSGSTLSLSFASEIGPKYVVEWKGALTNGAWNQLATNSGTGSPITVSDSTLTDAQRYYRVRMQ